MKTKLLILGVVIGASLTLGSVANAALYIFLPSQGGTGTSTAPTYGKVLVGNANGTYDVVATSTLGISASGTVVGTVSTSTTPTVGQLSYWTSAGYPSLLGSVATTSLTATSPLSLSQPISVIGSSASALTISTAGDWTGTLDGFNGFGYPFPSNATSTLIDFSGSIKIGTLAGLVAGNSGNLYAVSTTSMNASITGLAGTATALATPRAINGVNFDGTAPITITAASSTLLTDQNIFSVGTTTMVNGHYTGNLQVDGKFFAPVTLVASGDTTINGALTVMGATTLATSLTGLLKASSGLVSVASAGSDYENPLTFSFPLIRTTNAISFNGLSTSTAAVVGNIPYFSSANQFANVATSSLSLGLGLSGSNMGYLVGGSSPSLSIATSSLYSGTTGQFPYFSGTNAITATSSIFIATSGNVGIGTTTPQFKLEIQGVGLNYAGTGYFNFRTTQENTAKRGISLGYDTSGQVGVILSDTQSAASDLAFWTYNGSAFGERMRITSSGNVGIGISPTSPLHVDGAEGTFGMVTIGNPGVRNGASIALGAGTVAQDRTWKFQTSNVSNGDLALLQSTTQTGSTFAAKMVWSAAGNVGIGTTSPATKLDVNGTITQLTVKSCTLGLTTDALGSITGCVASDERLKTNITSPDFSALSIIGQLNPIQYQWKNTANRDALIHSGFVAQEVEKVFPSAVVNGGTENGVVMKAVDPNAINALLVKGMKEQQKQIDELRAELDAFKRGINACYAN